MSVAPWQIREQGPPSFCTHHLLAHNPMPGTYLALGDGKELVPLEIWAPKSGQGEGKKP